MNKKRIVITTKGTYLW